MQFQGLLNRIHKHNSLDVINVCQVLNHDNNQQKVSYTGEYSEVNLQTIMIHHPPS